MSNLFKSKFLLGVMIVAVMFVFAGTVGTKTASAACSITTTLRQGSSGAQVSCLQNALGGLTVDGNFGPHTKAAVMAFQTAHGLTADGVFGPMSNAAWMSASSSVSNAVYPAGCMSNSGFSSITGAACSGGGNLPTGCTSTAGFSPVTGQACNGAVSNQVLPSGCTSASGFSPLTGVACTSGMTVNPTGSGNISADSILGGFANTVVGTGDTNHQISGFTLTGAGGGSNVTLNSLTLSFSAGPFTGACLSGTDCGSNRFSDYFSAVSVWEGSTQIGSVPSSAFSSNTINGVNNYVYSASVPISGATVNAGQNTNFYVAVSANSSLDTGNFSTGSGNLWAVQVGNIRYTDGTGVTLVYNPTASFPTAWGTAHTSTDPTFTFGSAATANNIVLNIGRSGSDQNAHTVTVNATGGSTLKVPLLAMTLTTQGGIPISLNKIPVVFTPTAVYYNTGTVGQSGTTVTGSGTTFTAAMIGMPIYYGTTTTAVYGGIITAFGSATSITVSTSQTVAGGSAYTIGGSSLVALSGEVYLMNGATVVDSESTAGDTTIGQAYTISFKVNPNPGLILQPGSQNTLTVAADINSVAGGGYGAGTSLTASTPIGSTAFDLSYGSPNGTELISSGNATTLVPGTANGQQVAFYATGASVNETSDVCTANNGGAGDPASLTCTIQYSVTANGAPVYLPQLAGTSATANVIGFDSFVSTAPTTPIVSGGSPAIGLSSTVVQNGSVATSAHASAEWVINAGATANFTATVVISDPTSAHPGQYRSYLVQVPWSLTDSASTWSTIYNFNLGSANVAVPGYTQLN